jgi:hypothetical protein
MTKWHIAYISIARGFFYNYYYLILEENNYIFEGMLIKIVISTFEYFYSKNVNERDSLFLIHYIKFEFCLL